MYVYNRLNKLLYLFAVKQNITQNLLFAKFYSPKYKIKDQRIK